MEKYLLKWIDFDTLKKRYEYYNLNRVFLCFFNSIIDWMAGCLLDHFSFLWIKSVFLAFQRNYWASTLTGKFQKFIEKRHKILLKCAIIIILTAIWELRVVLNFAADIYLKSWHRIEGTLASELESKLWKSHGRPPAYFRMESSYFVWLGVANHSGKLLSCHTRNV